MERIRLVFANLPRLMREILLNGLVDEPDLEVVATLERSSDLNLALNLLRPDAVVLSLDEGDGRARLLPLLYDHPTMAVLAVTPSGRTASVHELRYQADTIGQGSSGELFAAVRTLVRKRRCGLSGI